MQISYLADYPQFIDVLAPWVFAHWQPILDHLATVIVQNRRIHEI